MVAKILSHKKNELIIEIKIPLETTMLDGEQTLERSLNEVGALANGELLKRFDTDGSAIMMGSTKLTRKGQVEKTYQTPYGETRIKRHAYQTQKGGSTYCPLDTNARILNSATPLNW